VRAVGNEVPDRIPIGGVDTDPAERLAVLGVEQDDGIGQGDVQRLVRQRAAADRARDPLLAAGGPDSPGLDRAGTRHAIIAGHIEPVAEHAKHVFRLALVEDSEQLAAAAVKVEDLLGIAGHDQEHTAARDHDVARPARHGQLGIHAHHAHGPRVGVDQQFARVARGPENAAVRRVEREDQSRPRGHVNLAPLDGQADRRAAARRSRLDTQRALPEHPAVLRR